MPTCSVAVVDDDAAVRKALCRLLRSAGFAVTTFESAEEFLDRGLGDPANCLVLDIHLGGMSGFDLHDELVRAGSTIPVIFITAHDDATTRDRLWQAGAVTCLRKPFDATALIEAIDRATGCLGSQV